MAASPGARGHPVGASPDSARSTTGTWGHSLALPGHHVRPTAGAMPPMPLERALDAQQPREVEEDDGVRRGDPCVHRRAVVAVDDPVVGLNEFFVDDLPLFLGHRHPTGLPEEPIEVDHRQGRPLAEFAREHRLPGTAATNDGHSFHRGACAVAAATKRSNTASASSGPGAPSGWYWTVSMGSSWWRNPSTEPSLRLTWLT